MGIKWRSPLGGQFFYFNGHAYGRVADEIRESLMGREAKAYATITYDELLRLLVAREGEEVADWEIVAVVSETEDVARQQIKVWVRWEGEGE